jgi:pimeloyl-ACP methyl ester carboxylesterase
MFHEKRCTRKNPFCGDVVFRLKGGAYVTNESGTESAESEASWTDPDGEGVYNALKKGGYAVTVAQIATASLADDVATTKRAIAEQNGPVILVGHSYGGVVITEAGNDPKVAGLVYVAAFAPDKGESVSTLGAPVKVCARLLAFVNSFISGRPTAALSASTTASNGLEEITLTRSTSIFVIAMFALTWVFRELLL